MPPSARVSFAGRRSAGFALLVTIVLVAFLVLILVGLATFTRVETQVAGNSQQLAQARQNALMALNVAVGQLQKHAGPDQRVTATADLADGANGTAANGLVMPVDGTRKWTGVWSAQHGAPTAPVLLNWLVSGNEGLAFTLNASSGRVEETTAVPQASNWRPDDAVTGLATGMNGTTPVTVGGNPGVLLAGPGSVGAVAGDVPGYVVAPKVPISGEVPGLAGSQEIGCFAWWVADEGTKARINLRDTRGGADPLRVQSSARSGSSLLTGLEDFPLDSPDVEKLLIAAQTPFVLPSANISAVKSRFHDVSLSSQGVLSDVREGGLKRDLGYLFELSLPAFRSALGGADGVFSDIDPSFSASGAFNPIVEKGISVPNFSNIETWSVAPPTWEQLRSFFRQGRLTTDGGLRTTSNDYRPRAQTATEHGLHPLMLQAKLGPGVLMTPEGANYRLWLKMRAAVVLANPYTIPIEAGTYYVTFAGAGNFTIRRNGGGAGLSVNSPTLNSLLGAAKFRLTCPRLEPGEARVFTLDSAQPGPGWDATSDTFLLTSSEEFPMTGSDYSEETGVRFQTSLSVSAADAGAGYGAGFGGDGSGFEATLWTASPTDVTTVLTRLYIAGNSGPGDPPNYAATPTNPETWGGAFVPIWLNLRNDNIGANAEVSPLPESNIRALFPSNFNATQAEMPYLINMRRTPVFSFTSHTFLSSPPDARMRWAGGWVNQAGANPDPGLSAQFFHVPRTAGEIVSLAQLQHFNASGFIPNSANGGYDHIFGSAPGSPAAPGLTALRSRGYVASYAIGNSQAPLYIQRNQTRTDHSSDGVYHDASYLLNLALWDRFYFSSVPQGGAAFDFSTADLVNARYQPFRGELAPANVGAYRSSATAASENLLVRGAFNVNSTSVEAWTAFLGGLIGIEHNGESMSDASGSAGFAPVMRSAAHGGASATATDPRTDDAWTGFRKLSAAQIRALATSLVDEVKARGPFLNLSDFVNRRLVSGSATGIRGPVAAAILASGINPPPPTLFQKPASTGTNVADLEHRVLLTPSSLVSGIPGNITQADILGPLAPYLSARSDTFTVRAYGEVLNPAVGDGVPVARAWCEATIQRLPDWGDSSQPPSTRRGNLTGENLRFGRQFKIVGFRWLNSEDI